MRVSVEVCVTSVHEAQAAQRCGADSIELCSWLACGGVTPSPGLVSVVRGSTKIPLRILVRPTPGAFKYDKGERRVLFSDAGLLGGGGKLGIVTGGLLANGDMDPDLMRHVLDQAPENEITFHRAIDQSRDPVAVLDECMELGIHRVLTSGAKTFARDGAAMIKQLVDRAGDRVMIAGAGGINASNVVELVERTGVREVHFAAQLPVNSTPSRVSMSSTNQGITFETMPDQAKIEGVLNALTQAGLR